MSRTALRSWSSGSLDRVDGQLDGDVEQVGFDGQRWADLDDVLVMPATAEEDATLECRATDRRSTLGIGRTRLPVSDDLDPREQAQPSDLADGRIVLESGGQPGEHALAEPRGALDQPFVAHDADRGKAGCEVDRIA